MRQLTDVSKQIPMCLLVAICGGLLIVTAPRVEAKPNCKPNRATCTANDQCCSGACMAGLCVTPTTTSTSTSTSSTTTSSTMSTSTTTPSTTTTTLRFVDNGNGTVTDLETGLQWEKKDSAGGGANYANPHDVDNTYEWSTTGTAPDGGAFTSFLSMLNGGVTGVGECVSSDDSSQTGGFANHCDWRLPTIVELRTINDPNAPGCGTGGPCIDVKFGATGVGAPGYWSSTTWAADAARAWLVFFDSVGGFPDDKGGGNYVRAVRGGFGDVCGPGECETTTTSTATTTSTTSTTVILTTNLQPTVGAGGPQAA